MCHTILSRAGVFVEVTRQPNLMLMGLKRFVLKDHRWLYSAYAKDNNFAYNFEVGFQGLKAESIADTQQVSFRLPVTSVGHSAWVESQVEAGYHISPFHNLQDGPYNGEVPVWINITLPNAWSSPKTELTTPMEVRMHDGVILPVCFRLEDVRFYDGFTVSCSEFLIPEPSLLANREVYNSMKDVGEKLNIDLYVHIYDLLLKTYKYE